MRPSSDVHPLTEPAALLCLFFIQFWPQESADTGYIKKNITPDGTSTYMAELRGPKTRTECKNIIAVQEVPSRDEHLKTAA
jgi:hypothetical protein